ncbi:TetR/AcrR family transcriptional regulator [Actinomyces vulturis]|uniref:TetR/AcrR family transcriptional regulator n=1 Tax=Actinomyces vulturis TaxID=1857645 RepID=UPI0008309277|nr:TetR/AcrR family transcriptional regulator [Actinomyces vulturis]
MSLRANTNAAPIRPGRKTGPKPKFSADDVIDAALQLGLDTFTMAQVAQAVGVGAPSLYRLFSSRDDLVGACLDRIASQIRWNPQHKDWLNLLRSWARMCWDLCETYPGFDITLYTYPFPQVHFMDYAERVFADFRATGQDNDTITFMMDFIGDTVITIHLGLGAYQDRHGHSPNQQLLQHNLERSREQIDLDVSAFTRPDNAYERMVQPKVEFLLAALDAGVTPSPTWLKDDPSASH